ncbi:hypothetical protein Tco_1352410, partial [Tanacetum coccineum]
MESVSAQMVATAKLPVLNPGEFELWKMKIEQYFLMTDGKGLTAENVSHLRFPRAYALDACKEITVGSKFMQPAITYSFRRPPRGGAEQMQTDELTTLMQNVSL